MSTAAVLMLIATGGSIGEFSEVASGGQRVFGEGARAVRGIPEVIGEGGALLLLTGGLLVLLMALPLALLKSMNESAQEESVKAVTENNNPPASKYEVGFRAGRAIDPHQTDEVAESLEHLTDARVRITNSNGKYKILQIHNCRGCSRPVCEFERGFLTGAFSRLQGKVEVKETKCRATGAPACEFNVKRR